MTVQPTQSMHLGFNRGTRDCYTIEPEHLRTHAMCVGMTGSGKTGLCIALLEELAIAKVPMVLVDPKGDLANIMLAPRSPMQMKIFVREEDATACGMTHDEYAEKMYAEWDAARAADGGDTTKLDAFGTTLFRIYTPGGGPGLGLSIVSALKRPTLMEKDAASRADIVADSILGMCEKSEQTAHARALVAQLLVYAWTHNIDSSLHALVDEIIDPPFAHLGGLDIETYFPRAKRVRLAQELNGIMASPAWESWLVGYPLEFGSLLYTDEGEPTCTIINIAHLGDAQRQFFVGLLLNQAIQWMRTQRGTTALRALLYMDEVAGYFPPNGNPPAKRAALTLVKQARAFGLGVMFASQNPADLDYKLLGNMGLWLIGKLNTERDKARLEAGLEGAVKIPELAKREFLVRNIHAPGPAVLMRSRCTMSYLFGPIASEMIAALAAADGDKPEQDRQLLQQRLERLQVAIDKQAEVVGALQKEVMYAIGGNFLTVLVSFLGGRRATAMRQMTRQPPKKTQALLEARARLQAMKQEYAEIYKLWDSEK